MAGTPLPSLTGLNHRWSQRKSEYLKKLNTKEECENQFSFVWQSLLKASSPRCAAEVLEQVMAWSGLDAERKIALPNPVTAVLLDPSLVADDDNCDY